MFLVTIKGVQHVVRCGECWTDDCVCGRQVMHYGQKKPVDIVLTQFADKYPTYRSYEQVSMERMGIDGPTGEYIGAGLLLSGAARLFYGSIGAMMTGGNVEVAQQVHRELAERFIRGLVMSIVGEARYHASCVLHEIGLRLNDEQREAWMPTVVTDNRLGVNSKLLSGLSARSRLGNWFAGSHSAIVGIRVKSGHASAHLPVPRLEASHADRNQAVEYFPVDFPVKYEDLLPMARLAKTVHGVHTRLTGPTNNSVGGALWYAASIAAVRYLEGKMSDMEFIDAVFDMTHNGGPVLNKVMRTGYFNVILDFKREATAREAVGLLPPQYQKVLGVSAPYLPDYTVSLSAVHKIYGDLPRTKRAWKDGCPSEFLVDEDEWEQTTLGKVLKSAENDSLTGLLSQQTKSPPDTPVWTRPLSANIGYEAVRMLSDWSQVPVTTQSLYPRNTESIRRNLFLQYVRAERLRPGWVRKEYLPYRGEVEFRGKRMVKVTVHPPCVYCYDQNDVHAFGREYALDVIDAGELKVSKKLPISIDALSNECWLQSMNPDYYQELIDEAEADEEVFDCNCRMESCCHSMHNGYECDDGCECEDCLGYNCTAGESGCSCKENYCCHDAMMGNGCNLFECECATCEGEDCYEGERGCTCESDGECCHPASQGEPCNVAACDCDDCDGTNCLNAIRGCTCESEGACCHEYHTNLDHNEDCAEYVSDDDEEDEDGVEG